MNAHHEPVRFRLPSEPAGVRWEVVADTTHPDAEPTTTTGGDEYEVTDRALVLFRAAE